MNTLGHAYVATRAVAGNRELLITGALIPESSPFIPDNPFTWKEIHESGGKLLAFLDQNHPQKRDLALGILTHSLKYGADGFNKEIEKYVGGRREEILEKISLCSQASFKTAAKLVHNCLGGGLDYWILQTSPDLVEEVKQAIKDADVREIGCLLSACFDKDSREVEKVLGKLFQGIYKPGDLTSLEGLTRTWIRQAEGLADVGRLDFPKMLELVKISADLLKDDWHKFLETVVNRAHRNLLPFLKASDMDASRL